MWINTKVEFEWDGEKYVEVHSEGYEYEGILDYCLEEDEGGREGPREREIGEPFERKALRPWIDNPEQGQVFFDWLLSSGIIAPQLRDRITNFVSAEELIGAEKLLDAWKNWYSQAFPGDEPGDELGDEPGDEPGGDIIDEDDPNAPRKVGDKWIDSAGNLWTSSEEAYASNVRIRQLEEKRLGRQADYERRFAEYEELIATGTAEERSLAQRLAARTKGELKRDVRSAMFRMGETLPEGFEERLEESSTRNLLDMMSNIEQRNIAKLTAAKQFEIGTGMSLEQIGLQEEGLEKQMYQYLSTQAQRETEFEGTMALQRSEQALRKELGLGQLDLGREQLAWQQQYGGEEFDIMRAQIEGQPQWWESFLGSAGQGAGMYTAAKLGSKLIPGVQAIPWCFDGYVNVIGKNGFIPMSMLKQGTRISTAKGYKPVKRVYRYNTTSTLNIDAIRVTKGHPYILNNGSLELAGNLKVGDKLWGGKAIKSIDKEKGSGTVFNIDIDGNTFYLGNATLVHTGRDKNGI